ncbi:hypothetical protein K435DRAFT_775011 [Dendrothele bispora CBS 962.96]|uniref:DUF6533 domain-containing protein n=1 Tax=Dendrothele bispora (strain CBS 962.96) TaxID=1314807 RepID=A0A4S8MKL2_DENBC|nr:hypothetical protein K435DRAFT_775011 [Dendrothele bispora CBS 962.96]
MSQAPPLKLIPGNLVVCITLLVYDYICTLDQEVTYVWSKPLALGSILFFINRYLPFIDAVLNINVNFAPVITPEQCLVQNQVIIWFMFVGMAFAEVVLMLRTYALWERRRSILIFFCLLTLAFLPPCFYFTVKEAQSLRYGPTPLNERGCNMTDASNIIFIVYALLALCEFVAAGVMGVKGYQHIRRTRSPWVMQFYKEGILLYVYLIVLTVGNMFSSALGPSIGPWLAYPHRILHSIICNRVLFLVMGSQQETTPRRYSSRDIGSHYLHSSSLFTTVDMQPSYLTEESWHSEWRA